MYTSETKPLNPQPNTQTNTTKKEVAQNNPQPHKKNPDNNQTVAIAAVAIAALVAVFPLAFKKGYVTIEVVDEENPQETSNEYTISILS